MDTGRARSNWQVNLDGPATGVVEPLDRSGQTAMDRGQVVVSSYRGGGKNDSIHITNNLPYIERLNEGHSAQAPTGFVELAVAAGVSAVKGAKLLKD